MEMPIRKLSDEPLRDRHERNRPLTRTAFDEGEIARLPRHDVLRAGSDDGAQRGVCAADAPPHPRGATRELTLHPGTLNAVQVRAAQGINREIIGTKWDAPANGLGRNPDAWSRA